jgi:HD superfamily phosphodiesterase
MDKLELERANIDFSQRLSPEIKGRVLGHVEGTARRVFAEMPLLPVHDILHVERVVRNTQLICEGEGVDPFLPTVCAWLHDIGRLQEIQAKGKGERVYHAEASAQQVPSILEQFRPDLGEAIEMIQDAVGRHSSKNADDDPLPAIILKDADRLDGIGAIGLPRVFAFYPERPIYKPDSPFGEGETSEEYLRYSGQSTQIEAFFRNMEWFPWLRSRTAIKMGIPRITLMMGALYQLADELGRPRGEIDNHPIIQGVKEKIAEFQRA